MAAFFIVINIYLKSNKMIQPKPFLDKFKIRHKAKGVERRRNMSKIILEHAPNFPLSVEYKDIDEAFQKWVENDLDIEYDGKKIPTFKLFSNQRINEYAQSWKHLDEVGNLLMNFKTITRENNPKHGENQGGYYNIPGDRDYPMFMVPVLQENGQEAYDMYSMKQPFCVDMVYSVSIITNKYELINKVNQLIHNKFKAINCYIAPNHHYMPMVLEDISDESEYSLDDRKYYSQTFRIKVKAYIISEEDFKVTRLESRIVVRGLGERHKLKPKIELEEMPYINDECEIREEYDPYYNKKITINISYPVCDGRAEFDADFDLIIRQIETNNIYDFVICINGEKQDLETDVRIYKGDSVSIAVTNDEVDKTSSIKIVGLDPTAIFDERYDPESALDEPITEEIIDIKL